jgi:hypothetical protein
VKRCAKCGRELPLTEFRRDSRKADGRQSRCKACQSTGRPSGSGAGRKAPQAPVICVYDPAGMYAGRFDRMSWTGSLWDETWESGMLVEFDGARWRVDGRRVYELDGGRVLEATGKADKPVLRAAGMLEAAG